MSEWATADVYLTAIGLAFWSLFTQKGEYK